MQSLLPRSFNFQIYSSFIARLLLQQYCSTFYQHLLEISLCFDFKTSWLFKTGVTLPVMARFAVAAATTQKSAIRNRIPRRMWSIRISICAIVTFIFVLLSIGLLSIVYSTGENVVLLDQQLCLDNVRFIFATFIVLGRWWRGWGESILNSLFCQPQALSSVEWY